MSSSIKPKELHGIKDIKEEYILDPVMSNFILLDSIARRTTANLKVQETIQASLLSISKQMQLTNKYLNLSLEQQKLILEQQKLTLENQILATKELLEDADMGEYLTESGTVTTTVYTIINTIISPGFPVKGYDIENIGPNDIYFAHNYVNSSTGSDVIDVASSTSRFRILAANKQASINYNRKKIRNIYMLANNGNSRYKITLLW